MSTKETGTYTFALQAQVQDENFPDALPIAEGSLTYRKLNYAQMSDMEKKFFVDPLTQLQNMAQERSEG